MVHKAAQPAQESDRLVVATSNKNPRGTVTSDLTCKVISYLHLRSYVNDISTLLVKCVFWHICTYMYFVYITVPPHPFASYRNATWGSTYNRRTLSWPSTTMEQPQPRPSSTTTTTSPRSRLTPVAAAGDWTSRSRTPPATAGRRQWPPSVAAARGSSWTMTCTTSRWWKQVLTWIRKVKCCETESQFILKINSRQIIMSLKYVC